MIINYTDGRFKGFRKFRYYIDFSKSRHFVDGPSFWEVREWCWQTYGPSKEIDSILDDYKYQQFDKVSHSKKWCWQSDNYTQRLYLAGPKEADWFTLKWL